MEKYKDILRIAADEIGYIEQPSNLTRYGDWFGLDGLPWCGIFVSWVYSMALKPLGNIGFTKGFAGCQTAVKHFKDNNNITQTPTPGDIVFFDWNNDGRYDHTGIFTDSIDNTYFNTIEGNTSTKNNSNGGFVMRRKRKYSQAIFVHI